MRAPLNGLGPTATLLEWDDNIPTFDEVHAEALKANRFLAPTDIHSLPTPIALATAGGAMTLLDFQRRMAEDVSRPLTTDFAMQSFTSDGSSVSEIATGYVKPNDRLSSFERLEIYNRQYWFRLIAAVSEDYPALNAILGPTRFDDLILEVPATESLHVVLSSRPRRQTSHVARRTP